VVNHVHYISGANWTEMPVMSLSQWSNNQSPNGSGIRQLRCHQIQSNYNYFKFLVKVAMQPSCAILMDNPDHNRHKWSPKRHTHKVLESLSNFSVLYAPSVSSYLKKLS